jgi:hypothetical protein
MWPKQRTRRIAPVALFAALYTVAVVLAVARGAPVLEEIVPFLFGLVVGGVPYAAFTFLGEDTRTFPWLVVLGGLLTLTFLYTFVGPLAIVWAWPLQLLLPALAAVPFVQVGANAKMDPTRR